MAQLEGRDDVESLRSIRLSFRTHASSSRRSLSRHYEDEDELQWAAIERLPTFERLRTSLFDQYENAGLDGELKGKRVIDVTKLGGLERRVFIENLIQHIERDNLRLLQKQRERINIVGVELPTVEVSYKNLCVEAVCEVVQGKPLPTLWNKSKSSKALHFMRTSAGQGLARIPGLRSEEAKISIIKDVSGIIRPSRMTLLLGPPGCGKSTLLLALAGKLNRSLKVKGEISYNGFGLEEFVPQKTAAYISQYEKHS
ncbi:Pleiotropic drug resistance protein 3 [Acorus calamus]|uniref:Pleiotropic drug resistance protein 3 n=1 Tax=Acorus calamus TaxID=4465 RepID=A0AAV9F4G6_ACOCL|nr:Pleiotropic drug resistance protein 3 [Acorus calamus]